MANIAALTLASLTNESDINYYVQQQIYWSNKYEANAAKLAEQVKFENQWEKAYDDAQDVDKACKVGNTVWKEKGADPLSDKMADAYAHAKVTQYDEELKLELADNDMTYDMMKSMYETLLEKMRAGQEGLDQAAATAAKDTGLMQS